MAMTGHKHLQLSLPQRTRDTCLFAFPGLFQSGFISTTGTRVEGDLPSYETKKEVALRFPIVRGNGRSGMGPDGRCRGSERQFS
jgi:hypothetical protein